MDVREQLEKVKGLQKNALLIAPTILILCLIFVFLILPKYDEYQNLDKEVQNLENDIALLKSAASPQTQALLEKKMKETEFDLKTTKEKLEIIRKIIPPKPNLDEILDIISLDAKESAVTLNSLKPSAEENITLFYNKNTNRLETFNPQPVNNQNNNQNNNQINNQNNSQIKVATNNQIKVQDKNKKQEQKAPDNAVTFKKININVDVSGSFNSIENFLGKLSRSERFISVENISIKKEGGTLRALISLSTYYLPEQQ